MSNKDANYVNYQSNLLYNPLTPSQIKKVVELVDGFKYNVGEGGYVSEDCAVILIEARCPYNGMLMFYGTERSPVTIRNWINKVEAVL